MRDAGFSWASPPTSVGRVPALLAAARAGRCREILGHRVIWSCVVSGCPGRGAAPARPGPLDLGGPLVHLVLTLAAVVITVNWTTYIWGVNNGKVVETSLGYFVNPRHGADGVVILHERVASDAVGGARIASAAVVVLTLDYGHLPVALVLAFSFGSYGLCKKTANVGATESLAYETAVIAPFAAVYLVWLASRSRRLRHPRDVARAAFLTTGIVTAVPHAVRGGATGGVDGDPGPAAVPRAGPAVRPGVFYFHEAMPAGRWVGFTSWDRVDHSPPRRSPTAAASPPHRGGQHRRMTPARRAWHARARRVGASCTPGHAESAHLARFAHRPVAEAGNPADSAPHAGNLRRLGTPRAGKTRRLGTLTRARRADSRLVRWSAPRRCRRTPEGGADRRAGGAPRGDPGLLRAGDDVGTRLVQGRVLAQQVQRPGVPGVVGQVAVEQPRSAGVGRVPGGARHEHRQRRHALAQVGAGTCRTLSDSGGRCRGCRRRAGTPSRRSRRTPSAPPPRPGSPPNRAP